MNQEGKRYVDEKSDAEESKKLLGEYLECVGRGWERCQMLKHLLSETKVTKQEKIDINIESLRKITGRMTYWKSPGPDLVEEFWLKN